MKIVKGFDPERQMIIITITSNLFIKYFASFCGLVNSAKDIPENTVVETAADKDTVNVLFPLPKDSETRMMGDSRLAIALDRSKIDKLYDIIYKFVNTAVRKELSKIEFLPLNEYPIEDLKKDVEEAVKNKRNFCLIRNYSDYLKGCSSNGESKLDFDQYLINYLDEEYCDVAVEITRGNISGLKKKYEPLLKKIEWY